MFKHLAFTAILLTGTASYAAQPEKSAKVKQQRITVDYLRECSYIQDFNTEEETLLEMVSTSTKKTHTTLLRMLRRREQYWTARLREEFATPVAGAGANWERSYHQVNLAKAGIESLSAIKP